MPKKSFLKKIRYFFEALAVRLGLALFQIIGIKNASNFGSFLARNIGKRISVQKLARSNLNKAFPDLKTAEIEKILDDMWDNLGRIVGEFSHCCRMGKGEIVKHATIDAKSLKNLENVKNSKNGGIIFSAHIGNWEIGPKFFLHHGINVKTVYRPLNNEIVDKVTSQARKVDLIPKNTKGNKQIINEIKNGNYIIILVDQKITDGISVPFFHDNALTSASIAKLALKYDIPLIPARSIRIGKEFNFKIEIEDAVKFDKTDAITEEQVFNLTKKINEKLESWIREYPAQWFWVHNRWKK